MAARWVSSTGEITEITGALAENIQKLIDFKEAVDEKHFQQLMHELGGVLQDSQVILDSQKQKRSHELIEALCGKYADGDDLKSWYAAEKAAERDGSHL